jgi:hypothetical protein
MGHLIAVVPAMLLGFLTGLLSFKVKSRWCAECGTVKSCPRCAGWANPLAAQGSSESTTTAERQREMPGTHGRRKRGADELESPLTATRGEDESTKMTIERPARVPGTMGHGQ